MTDATRELAPREVAALLRAISTAMIAEISALPEDVLAWHPAPGEWCAKECLGHLLEAERRGFNGRIRTILAQLEPPLPGWDQQVVQLERRDCQRASTELVAEFQALRSDSVALLESLTPADLERGGTHDKVGYLKVKELIHEWVHHDRNHFRQLEANIQAYVWPAMGNGQKFAGD